MYKNCKGLQKYALAATMAAAAGSVSAQETIYAVTETSLVTITADSPLEVEIIGEHGLEFITLGDGTVRGAFSMTYDPDLDRLLGLHYRPIPETNAFEQFLVEYDRETGLATPLALIADSRTDGFVEAIEYVDSLEGVVISRDRDGTITTSLELLQTDGSSVPLIDNGLDNDYAVYDQTRDLFYVMDPNGIGLVNEVNLLDGTLTPLTEVLSSTSDLAFSPEMDCILGYVNGARALIALGKGEPDQSTRALGLVPLPGPVLGLAVVPATDADPECAPDVNGDGIVDLGDISFYVNLFLTEDPIADTNGDGFIDLGDISAFVALFLEGCNEEG